MYIPTIAYISFKWERKPTRHIRHYTQNRYVFQDGVPQTTVGQKDAFWEQIQSPSDKVALVERAARSTDTHLSTHPQYYEVERDHGEVNYYIGQFLSGHGYFNAYLARMGKVEDGARP